MIKITKKGLAYSQWNKEKEDYEDTLIKRPSTLQLHGEECEIEDGVTLGDILFIIKRDLDWWDTLLECWVREYVEEGLTISVVSPAEEKDPLEYLELYWNIDEWEGEIEIPSFMSFHGIGKPYEYGQTNYGIGFSPVHELAPLPVKINKEFIIGETLKEKPFFQEKYKANAKPTLFQIIYGIFWELSFHGGPESRNAMFSELTRRVKEVEDGTAKLIPMEEVMENLGISLNDEEDDGI